MLWLSLPVSWAAPSLLLLTALLMFVAWWPKRELFKKGLRLPGPTPLPIFGNLLDVAKFSTNGLEAISGLCEKYNGFCALWQGHKLIVMIADPQYLKYLYTNIIDRADQFVHALELFGPETLFPSSGDTWRRSRKRFMMTFSPTPVPVMIENYSAVRDYMMNELKKRENGAEFQSWNLIQNCIGQSVIRTTLGDVPDQSFYTDVADQLDFVMRQMFKRQLNLMQLSNASYALTANGRKYMKSRSLIKDWCFNAIEGKKKEYEKMKMLGESMPNLWIYNTLEKFPNFDMNSVADDLANLIITGMETTTNAFGFQVLNLALHPDMQEKIYQEDKLLQESLRGRQLTLDDLDEHEFLDRFIKESMRMFPIGEIIGRKLDVDTYFGDHLIPKGANVMALPLMMNRDPKNFPDPLKFDPDRHLPENMKDKDPYLYASFGAGPRSCPGSKFAMVGLRILLLALVREYHISTSYKNVQELTQNVVAEPSLTDSRKFPISLRTRNPKV